MLYIAALINQREMGIDIYTLMYYWPLFLSFPWRSNNKVKFSMLLVEILSHVLVKLGRLFNGKRKHILETKN